QPLMGPCSKTDISFIRATTFARIFFVFFVAIAPLSHLSVGHQGQQPKSELMANTKDRFLAGTILSAVAMGSVHAAALDGALVVAQAPQSENKASQPSDQLPPAPQQQVQQPPSPSPLQREVQPPPSRHREVQPPPAAPQQQPQPPPSRHREVQPPPAAPQ
ncbi:MAG: hypothetical protein WB689_15720, partial [Xanthobacteraceae bacterium]